LIHCKQKCPLGTVIQEMTLSTCGFARASNAVPIDGTTRHSLLASSAAGQGGKYIWPRQFILAFCVAAGSLEDLQLLCVHCICGVCPRNCLWDFMLAVIAKDKFDPTRTQFIWLVPYLTSSNTFCVRICRRHGNTTDGSRILLVSSPNTVQDGYSLQWQFVASPYVNILNRVMIVPKCVVVRFDLEIS
jgi:hypothetical protein